MFSFLGVRFRPPQMSDRCILAATRMRFFYQQTIAMSFLGSRIFSAVTKTWYAYRMLEDDHVPSVEEVRAEGAYASAYLENL